MPPSFQLGGFRCELEGEDDEIGAYLASGTAAADQARGFSRSYLVKNAQDEVIAYCTLLADAIVLERGETDTDWPYESAPCLKVARIGVRCDQRRKGLGPKLMSWIIAQAVDLGERIGIRYITLDAVASQIPWYQSLGFEFTTIAGQPSTEADKAAGDRSMKLDLGRTADRQTSAE
jgi:GNAT superfamily N-acetyltransferase